MQLTNCFRLTEHHSSLGTTELPLSSEYNKHQLLTDIQNITSAIIVICYKGRASATLLKNCEQALSQPPVHPSFGRVKIGLDGQKLWTGVIGRVVKINYFFSTGRVE